MKHGDPSRPSLGRRAARAAVLLSSGGLAAVLVLRSGGGCDGPSSPPAEKAAPAAEAPAPVTPPAALGPAAAVEPAPAPAPALAPAPEPPGFGLGNEADNNAGNSNANAAPRYFPASKSGVFIDHDKPAPAPQKEPAVQQQAPSQVPKQAGSK